ncbi:hypothetical protein ACLB2K_063140 [Fragaria x ananassa]
MGNLVVPTVVQQEEKHDFEEEPAGMAQDVGQFKAHDDAINGLVASKGIVYSASADGKIKAWGKEGKSSHCLKGILEGHKGVSFNSVVVSEDGRWVNGGGSDGFL